MPKPRAVKQFTVGDKSKGADFSAVEMELLTLKLVNWYKSPECDRAYADPEAEAKEIIRQCLLGLTKDGKPWKGASNDFANRIKTKAAYDLTTDKGIRVQRLKNPNSTVVRDHEAAEGAKLVAEVNAHLIGFDQEEQNKFREQKEKSILTKFPELDNPVHQPHVRRLSLLYMQQELLDRELTIIQPKGKRLEAALNNLKMVEDMADKTMKLLDIHPDQLHKRIDKQKSATLGELVSQLEDDREFRAREKMWALQAAYQLWWMTKHPNGAGTGPQLEAWELWHMTRSKEVKFTCLWGREQVPLADGSVLYIKDIVQRKLPVTVMALDETTGEFVPRRVTGWLKEKRGERAWYHLAYEGTRPLSARANADLFGTWMTEDHRVLTESGWKQVNQLRDGDRIAVREWSPNQAQEDVILGTILGDAHVTPGRSITMVQTEAQEEWLRLKMRAFQGLGVRERREQKRGATQPSLRTHTPASSYAAGLRGRWYVEGHKVIPRDIVLSPRLLATWYLDDGSLTNGQMATLSTHCFTEADVDFLLDKLEELGLRPVKLASGKKLKRSKGAGIQVRIGNHTVAEENRWYRKLSHYSADKFFALIAPYVPPSMQYKLPEKFRGRFAPELWELGEGHACSFRKPVITRLDPASYVADVYCLEVEEHHNFALKTNIVVENCRHGEEYTLISGWEPHELKAYLLRNGMTLDTPAIPGLIPQEACDAMHAEALAEGLVAEPAAEPEGVDDEDEVQDA